jgi:hypothetical protein
MNIEDASAKLFLSINLGKMKMVKGEVDLYRAWHRPTDEV